MYGVVSTAYFGVCVGIGEDINSGITSQNNVGGSSIIVVFVECFSAPTTLYGCCLVYFHPFIDIIIVEACLV